MNAKTCWRAGDRTPQVRPAVPLIGAFHLAVLLPVVVCQAATYHVPSDFEKIQDAIDAATHEDVIVVATGTYEESIFFAGKNIVLRSLDPTNSEIVRTTILEPSLDLVVLFEGTETRSCVLAGFTITGGEGDLSGLGGAIIGNHALATISRNVIQYNTGSLIKECDGTISYNIIQHNGSRLRDCDGSIVSNVLANDHGGLILCDGLILNNTIVYNTNSEIESYLLPGLQQCSGEIENCIIWGNGESPADSIRDSSTPSYCCIEDWAGGGEGNIFTDPRFVDPENGDFRLQPDSFCIDSGGATDLVTEDIDGVLRPFDAAPDSRGEGSDIDIGAYEFVGAARANQIPIRPTNLSPPDGATGQITILELSASPFEDPDPGDFHTGSQWQVADDITFASPEFDSGPTPLEKTAARVTPHHLRLSTDYWWRVRYLDQMHGWSDWSAPTGFSTRFAEGIVVPRDYPTIQGAVDAATHGETVTVLPGTYYESVWMDGKNITLQSLEPTDDAIVAQTVIDASRSGPAVLYLGTETGDSVLAGFTLTNAAGRPHPVTGNKALGAVSGNDAWPLVQNNRMESCATSGIYRCNGLIENNTVRYNEYHGISTCDGRIERNLIHSNTARYGGGVYNCNATITKNVICYNTALYYDPFPLGRGGGLYDCHNTIEGNLICGNTSWEGSALAACSGKVLNNTIVENGWSAQLLHCTGKIENCIIVDSFREPLESCSEPAYCFLSPWEGGGTGNLTGDPLFVDESNDDYHLLPDSRCIDAG